MAVNMGDTATCAGVVVSLGVSGVALWVSIRSERHAKRSADAAERQAVAAEKALPPPPPAVAWEIERAARDVYRLRHVGSTVATGVMVDTFRAPAVLDLDLGDGTVRPHASIGFVVAAYAEAPTPDELWVSWDGQPEAVPVPMPPGD